VAEGTDARVARPPSEAVLPAVGYAVLVAEAAALTWLWLARDVQAGDRIGHSIGWIGTASMLLMHVYSIRKRVRALSHLGKLSTWLRWHIFLGLQGALLVCFHSAHLTTLANISGATIACTLVVVASGIFGRYLYSLLPKALSGERLSARQIEAELAELAPVVDDAKTKFPSLAPAIDELQAMPPITGKLKFGDLLRLDLRTRRALAHFRRAIAVEKPSPELDRFVLAARRRGALLRRLGMLTAAERWFRGWHVFHKPLTFILAGVVVLHVVAHYIYAAQFGAG
jgi:hypothetical protein